MTRSLSLVPGEGPQSAMGVVSILAVSKGRSLAGPDIFNIQVAQSTSLPTLFLPEVPVPASMLPRDKEKTKHPSV